MSLVKLTTSLAIVVLVAAASGAGTAHAAERVFRTEHFALTWTNDRSDPDAPDLTDADGDGTPDAVARMTAAFEDARAFLLDDLGYRAPPTRGRYNLYLSAEIDRGLVRTGPGGEGRSKPSFITIPKDMLRSSTTEGEMRTFAVHEYFHAIQVGYDAGEDRWIFEASSSWVEGLFGPAREHNHVYLYDFVPRLELGLRSETGIHEYGAFLFLQFLTERYGGAVDERPAIVREIWEAMAVPEAIEDAPDDDSIGALERVLASRGIALDDAWGEFLVWAWQLDRFEMGGEYRRALRDQRWPNAPATPVASETCRLTANAPEDVLPGLGADYARFTPGAGGTARARVTVRGPAGATAFAIVRPVEGPPVVHHIAFDDQGIGVLDVSLGGRAARRVILGIGNGSAAPGTFEYTARLDGAGAVVAHPPAVPSSSIFGTGIAASGRVECGGEPAPFARVDVTQTEVVSGTTEITALTTDAFGNWALTAVPAATSEISVQVVDPLLSPASSAPSAVGVRVAVNMTIADDQLDEGELLTVDGNVAPVHAGRVLLERRRPNGRFETGAETFVDGDGGYHFDYAVPGPGVWEVRVTMPDTGDEDHLPGDSAPKLVQVGET